jgi:hypothetical protein
MSTGRSSAELRLPDSNTKCREPSAAGRQRQAVRAVAEATDLPRKALSRGRGSSRRGGRRKPPRYSSRSSASWLRSSLQRDSGRNLDGNVDCDSARTLGRNLTRCSARNRTWSSSRCSEGGGQSGGEHSRTSSPRRSSGDSSGRDFGGYGDSYGGGIGGVGKGIGARGLGIGKLGCGLTVAGECVYYIFGGSG